MSGLVPPHPDLKPDPFRVPHRKNAAEWLMYLLLLPFVPILWMRERLRRG